jgi:hypothetical protein
MGDVATYFSFALSQYVGKWETAGEDILSALKEPIVASNDYLQIVLFLFSGITPLNHFSKLVQSFDASQSPARREILLAAATNPSAAPWLTPLKGSFAQMDSWQRRAFLLAVRTLPKDERKFWLKGISQRLDPLEKEIARESSLF